MEFFTGIQQMIPISGLNTSICITDRGGRICRVRSDEEVGLSILELFVQENLVINLKRLLLEITLGVKVDNDNVLAETQNG
ncbi:hypothetical protein BCY86_03625 [Pajaroellobacter abortibovis]|uniref:Uncharacterized protein n=1 Tax=Pajaroellobacter abortibovis TaxID=1882918 RepID=A0A1L6MWS7_9BACT|nr:hypothetical protein BCY86_03625 [Pajaroellobacter abortibovis]